MTNNNETLLEDKIISDYWREKVSSISYEEYNPEFLYVRSGEKRVEVAALSFPADISDRVGELCNHNPLLTFVFHLSVLTAVIHRYTANREVFIGSRSIQADAAGDADRAYVLYKTAIAPGTTFRTHYARTKDEVVATENYSGLATEEFMQAAGFYSVRHLFRFAFTSAALHPDAEPDIFDVVFNLSADGKALQVQFDSGTYEPVLMDFFLQNYRSMLADIIKDVHKGLEQYALVTEKERLLQMVEFNESRFDAFPVTDTYSFLFEQQAKKSPSAAAITCRGTDFSYQQVSEAVDLLADYFSAHELIKDCPLVALLMERTEKLMITILALWKCGKAYVPIDSNYPLERINAILDESMVRAVITDAKNSSLLPASSERAHINYETLPHDKVARGERSERLPALDDLAYVIYTSGSTGKPKGVMIDHLGMINHIGAKITEFGINKNSVVAQNASQGFDISVWQMFAALLVGGKTCIIDNDVVLDLPRFIRQIDSCKVDILETVPSYLSEMMNVLESEERPQTFSSLRYLIVNAETLKHRLVARWLDKFPHIPIANTYGATEVSDDMCHYIMKNVPATETVPVMLGPIQHMRIYIVDEHRNICPVGIRGEIYIAGIGVGPGYFNDESKTKASFLNDHFSGNGERMYRTGDVGRFLLDGTMEFMGRKDFQVKVNGYRVELSEIESAVLEIEDVQDVIVLTRPDAKEKPVLCAYVICDDPETYDFEKIRTYLKNKLPDYMVPVSYFGLSRFPVNENGKVDRKLLRGMREQDRKRKPAGPVTETEGLLLAIWTDVLQNEHIGVEDNFFASGGHSLLATQIVSRIENTFGVRPSIRTIFEKQTVTQLALDIDVQKAALTETRLPPIVRVPRELVHPMSSAQQRIWFFDHLGSKTGVYNIIDVISIKGALEPDLVNESMNELIRRHEILRTTFRSRENQPVQVIAPAMDFHISFSEFTGGDEAGAHRMLQDYVEKEAAVKFDLKNGPLVRVHLVRFGHEDHALILNLHHIITDRWSVSIFVSDFVAIYKVLSAQQKPQLPDLSLQYVDFSHWQKKLFDGDFIAPQLAYWKTKLAGAPHYLDLPLDFKRPGVKSYKGELIDFSFGDDIKEELEKICVSEGVSLYMLLLASFSLLLSRYAQQNDMVIGTPVANRHYKELESMMGFFVNTLAIRIEIDEDRSFSDLLKAVRKTTLEAYSNQDLPFEKLLESLKIERSEAFSPLFQVMVGMQNAPMAGVEFDRWQTRNINFGSLKSKFDLELSIEEKNGALTFFIEYSTDIFEAATIERMIGHFKKLVADIVLDIHLPVKELSLIDAAELLALENFNKTAADFPADKTITGLFEEQAKAGGARNAISFGAERISYEELNSRANKLAHFLATKGCGRETVVGICIDRSIELIVGILGILKAGGAYLPFDPAYPVSRLDYMVDDSGVNLILTKNEYSEKFGRKGASVILIDKEAGAIGDRSSENPCVEESGDQLFYVIYTSGSTGVPKGVEGLHKGMVNRLNWVWKKYPFKEGEVCCQKAAISYGESISEIFSPLLQGVPLVIIPDAVLKDPQLLIRSLRENRVSRIVLVPTYLKELLDTFPDLGNHLPDLYLWTSSGEPLTSEIIADFKRKVPNGRLLNFYGSTEVSADVTYYDVTGPELYDKVPIGWPIDNTEVYVLDQNMKQLPVGIPGELYIGGSGLARGYYKKPQLTAEKFVANPFGQPGSVLFRSGDMVRYLKNGAVEYYGRKDSQVKIRGQRVEIGEIEAVLLKHPGVNQAAVQFRAGKNGDRQLVAFIVVNKGHAPHMNEISLYLKDHLPLFMVPAVLMEIDKMPLLPNGKLHKAMLPEVVTSGGRTQEKMGPRNNWERKLLSIWKAILPPGEIGIQDSFFDLGGHSLLTIRLVNQINSWAGVQIPIAEIFKGPTIEKMAAFLMKEASEARLERSLVPIQVGGSRPPLFFVPGVGGSVLYLRDLARQLGADQPFYGLQSIGLNGIGDPIKDIQSMAAYYIKEIKEVQPQGPYYLAGHSFGGKVAFEMSQQLLANGEKIAFLGVVEMNAPDPDYVQPDVKDWDETEWFIKVANTIGLYYGKSKNVSYDEFMNIDGDKRVEYLKSILEDAGFLESNSDLTQFEPFLNVLKTNFQASYPPPETFIPVDICLFLSEANAPDGTIRDLPSAYQNLDDWGWGNFSAGPVKTYVVPGNHHSVMLNPNAAILAAYFQENFKNNNE